MKLFLWFWGCFLIPLFSFCQQTQLTDDLLDLSQIEVVTMPLQNNSLLKVNELRARKKGRPNKFATAISQTIHTQSHGNWVSTKDDFLVWRLAIKSKNARSLNLGFTKFKMPKSGRLFLYNPDRSQIFGPFDQRDNEAHLELWTPIIKGDEIIMELQLAKEDENEFLLELSYINHDFIGIMDVLESGSCNLDVACGAEDGYPEVDLYRDIISSVGAFSINGTDQCSGVLINNTNSDCSPYFLTAQHCGVNPSNSASVVVYWNYENSYCRPPFSIESGTDGDGLRNDFNTGAAEVAEYIPSDFSLLLLDDPIRPESNIFASGWSRSNELNDVSIAIHHPNVEEKRISFDYDAPIFDYFLGDTVELRILDWDIGTTEGGSSGSPLYNSKKQIIGQLYEGFAACGNDDYDDYGWFGKSWEGGGTPSTQLKVWLDPENTNQMEIDGRYCSVFLELGNNDWEVCTSQTDTIKTSMSVYGVFDSLVHYSYDQIPENLNIEFSADSAHISESITVELSNLSSLADTSFTINLFAKENNLEAKSSLNIVVSNTIPAKPILVAPANNDSNIASNPRFSWLDNGSTNHEIQISETEDFAVLHYEKQNISEEFINIDDLNENTSFYWRLRSLNACGVSEWSDINNFSVGRQQCVNYLVQGLPLFIPQTAGSVTKNFEIEYDVVLSKLVVNKVKGIHSWISDIVISLENPFQQTVVLFRNICDFFPNFENFDLGFSDDAPPIPIPCPPTSGQLYIPEQGLNSFSNTEARGKWSIIVEDLVNFDGGSLDSLDLDICFFGANSPSLIPAKNYYNYCQNESNLFELVHYDVDISTLSLLSNGRILDFNIEPVQDDMNRSKVEIISTDSLSIGLNRINLTTEKAEASFLLLAEAKPKAVDLLEPIDGSTILTDDFTKISWTAESVNSEYLVEIALDSNFTTLVFEELTTNNSLDAPANLEKDMDYYLRLSATNECGSISEVYSFRLEGPSSIVENIETNYTVFPNPTGSTVNIHWSEKHRPYRISLFNIRGELVQTNSALNENHAHFDVSSFAAGLYILKFDSASGPQSMKITIQ